MKKNPQCLCHVFNFFLQCTCILYTCISKIFFERNMIWLSTILAAIILVLALSSPSFFCMLQEVSPADPPCSKTIGFYYPTKLISWSRKKLAFYQSIKTLFPLSTDSFYAQVSDSCPEIFAYCT